MRKEYPCQLRVRLKNKNFQSRDLCLRAACHKPVNAHSLSEAESLKRRRNGDKNETYINKTI